MDTIRAIEEVRARISRRFEGSTRNGGDFARVYERVIEIATAATRERERAEREERDERRRNS